MTKTFVLIYKLDRYTQKITKNRYTLFNKFQINAIFRYPLKVNSVINLHKEKLGNDNRKNLIYQINCNKNYVGQTKRLLCT